MRSLLTLAIAPVLVFASVAAAQIAHDTGTGNDACLDTVSAGAMSRALVYLHPEVVGDSSAGAIGAAGLLAQEAAGALRLLLGDSASTIPRGEPRVDWRHMHGRLEMVLLRDGRHRVDGADSLDAGMALLAQAIERVSPSEAADLLPTPGPDSVRIAFTLVWPTVDHAGRVRSVDERPLVPAFTIAYPWVDPVAPLRIVQPRYPDWGRGVYPVGAVILDFVVDTSGRADRATIHDWWPAGRPRLAGQRGEWYDEFVRAVRASVEQSRYLPARIGGCPTRQLVRQPFQFLLTQ